MSGPLTASEPLRVVVLGAGANVWQFHRPGLEAIGADVVAVHDLDRAAAQRVADVLGCAVADDLADALRHDADLAVVMTSHVHHAELAQACLRAGLHVLVEKPMAITAGETDAMVAEAARAGRLLAVGVQQRTRAEVHEARRLLHAGALGALQRFDVLAAWPRRSSYFRSAPWRATWAGEGGGILINQGQHDLDLLCWLAGPPASVVARTSGAMHGREVEDTTLALPYAIVLLRPTFASIPKDLADAAQIDGSSSLGAFVRIVLPLARPGLATVGVLSFLWGWGDLVFALTLTSDESKRVVTTGLANFFGAFATDWAGAMAFCSLAMLPPLVVFILAQRQVIAGLTTGGTKG